MNTEKGFESYNKFSYTQFTKEELLQLIFSVKTIETTGGYKKI